MDVYDEFKKYCEENHDNLRAEVMSGREMARRAFFYAWAAAKQGVHQTADSLCKCDNLTLVDNPVICPVCRERRM